MGIQGPPRIADQRRLCHECGHVRTPDRASGLCGRVLAALSGRWLRGQRLHRAGTGSILTAGTFPARFYARFTTVPQQRLPWEIWVNGRGERFIREDEPLVRPGARAVLNLPRLRYVIIFDENILKTAPPGLPQFSREELLEHCENHPMFARANSLEELAAAADVDAAGLAETVREYNEAVASGNDALGRKHLPAPVTRAPFYAITHLGSSATSSAGVGGQRRSAGCARQPGADPGSVRRGGSPRIRHNAGFHLCTRDDAHPGAFHRPLAGNDASGLSPQERGRPALGALASIFSRARRPRSQGCPRSGSEDVACGDPDLPRVGQRVLERAHGCKPLGEAVAAPDSNCPLRPQRTCSGRQSGTFRDETYGRLC